MIRPPFLSKHGGCGGVDKIEAAFQVNRDGAIELMFGDFQDGFRIRSAGIVDQQVQLSPGRNNLADNLMCVRKVGHISLIGQGPNAERFEIASRGRHFRVEKVHQRNIDAFFGQREGTGAANASRASGHYGGSGHAPLPFRPYFQVLALSRANCATCAWVANQTSSLALASLMSSSMIQMRER
jgi:hypothetical protein